MILEKYGSWGITKIMQGSKTQKEVEVICKDTKPCLPDVGAHDDVIGIRSGSHAMTRFSGP